MGTLQLAASMWFSRRSENSVTAPGLPVSTSHHSNGNHIPILSGHALHTSANAHVNHPRLDSIRNIRNRLQTTGALSVQSLDRGGLGEASNQGCGAEFSGTATRREDGSNRDILHQVGINLALIDDRLEHTGQHVSCSGVFEATLSALGQGSAQRTCYHDVIGVFLRDGSGALFATGAEVGGNLGETLLR